MCDSLVARGARTSDGATLFAKNSDRRGREAQPFVQFPEAFHPRGSTLRCTHIEIDQVAETYRVMGHSPAWCWGFEQGVNEHGVAIGNHATWSKDPVEEQPGLIGMDLVRLGLERGRDAREALELIAALIETHGQGGSAFAAQGDTGYQNSFVIADGRSAWVLETTARAWAARSVEGASLTNALTLGTDWQIGSRGLERHAMQHGFWTREGRLDFKDAYALEGWPAHLTERRRESAARVLEGAPVSVAALKAWLRNHGRQTGPPDEAHALDDPERFSVCMHADPVSTTTASMVARLPQETGRRPWPVWISFGTPCTGAFVPVYLDGVIPAPFARADPSGAGGQADTSSVWCVMRDLQECVMTNFEANGARSRGVWSEFERAIELDRVRVEQEATTHFAAQDVARGAEGLTRFMQTTAERLLDTAARLKADLEST